MGGEQSEENDVADHDEVCGWKVAVAIIDVVRSVVDFPFRRVDVVGRLMRGGYNGEGCGDGHICRGESG